MEDAECATSPLRSCSAQDSEKIAPVSLSTPHSRCHEELWHEAIGKSATSDGCLESAAAAAAGWWRHRWRHLQARQARTSARGHQDDLEQGFSWLRCEDRRAWHYHRDRPIVSRRAVRRSQPRRPDNAVRELRHAGWPVSRGGHQRTSAQEQRLIQHWRRQRRRRSWARRWGWRCRWQRRRRRRRRRRSFPRHASSL